MKNSLKFIVLFGLWWLSLWCTFAVQDCADYFDIQRWVWLDLLVDENDKTVFKLIDTFCEQAPNMTCQYGDFYFDATQSVFLSLLCDNVWRWGNYISGDLLEWDDAILKKHTFLSFDIHSCIGGDSCVPWWRWDACHFDINGNLDMRWCDLAYFLPKIFDPLMNDFFNIKQAWNMWIVELGDQFSKEEVVDNYMKSNFAWLSSVDDMKDWFCKSKYYTQTCKYVKNYMTQLKNLLVNTKILDVKNLSVKAKTDEVDCENDFAENILYCGLLWDTKTSMVSFLKVVYNEYYRYHLFMSYYMYELANDYRFSDETDYTSAINSNAQKVYSAKENISRSKEAITKALKSLSEINYTFPMHVWFLMYQEDIVYFMENLPKIYTPLRTLYDKLRNVQDANS